MRFRDIQKRTHRLIKLIATDVTEQYSGLPAAKLDRRDVQLVIHEAGHFLAQGYVLKEFKHVCVQAFGPFVRRKRRRPPSEVFAVSRRVSDELELDAAAIERLVAVKIGLIVPTGDWSEVLRYDSWLSDVEQSLRPSRQRGAPVHESLRTANVHRRLALRWDDPMIKQKAAYLVRWFKRV